MDKLNLNGASDGYNQYETRVYMLLLGAIPLSTEIPQGTHNICFQKHKTNTNQVFKSLVSYRVMRLRYRVKRERNYFLITGKYLGLELFVQKVKSFALLAEGNCLISSFTSYSPVKWTTFVQKNGKANCLIFRFQ